MDGPAPLQKCTRIAVLVPALPSAVSPPVLHPPPSPGTLRLGSPLPLPLKTPSDTSFAPPFRNSIRYVFCSSPPVAASVHAHFLSLAFPC